MRPWVLLGWLGAATALAADEPPQADKSAACLQLGDRIVRPRDADQPLLLYTRDASGRFHPACTVPWSRLSPKNESLPVDKCFSGSMLQVENDTACGPGTGPLWVSTRWVVTSGEVPPPPNPAKSVAICQELQTGAYAASRDYKPGCKARKTEPQPRSMSQPPAAAETPPRESPPAPAPPPSVSPETAPPETPAPATPHPDG